MSTVPPLPALTPASTEAEVAASLSRAQALAAGKNYSDKHALCASLSAIQGHPLQTLRRENEALTALIWEARETLSAGEDAEAPLAALRELSVHYAKKGDLLYPLLKTRYGIAGPSDLMWTEDDEIRDALTALLKTAGRGRDWRERVDAVLTRAEAMARKEASIFFPLCAVNLSEAEWRGIYRDAKDYGDCLGVKGELWPEAEAAEADKPSAAAGEIAIPGGHLTPEQLTALLNTIPMEITFIDAENINRYFNEGPKVFKRPAMALDREVFSCHPPKIEPMVRAIIDDFRSGRRDVVPVWTEKNGRTMLVRYMAVRDRGGSYLGTVELVQDMEFTKEHFMK